MRESNSSESVFFNRSNKMILKFGLLLFYLAILSYGLFFAERLGRSEFHSSYNLEPFKEIKRYITYADSIGWGYVLINIFGNIIMFWPFGFLLPSMWPSNDKKHPLGVIFLGALFSANIEILQLITGVGSADVDDVLLNTIGAFMGYLLYILWRIIRYGSINVYEEEYDD